MKCVYMNVCTLYDVVDECCERDTFNPFKIIQL